MPCYEGTPVAAHLQSVDLVLKRSRSLALRHDPFTRFICFTTRCQDKRQSRRMQHVQNDQRSRRGSEARTFILPQRRQSARRDPPVKAPSLTRVGVVKGLSNGAEPMLK